MDVDEIAGSQREREREREGERRIYRIQEYDCLATSYCCNSVFFIVVFLRLRAHHDTPELDPWVSSKCGLLLLLQFFPGA
jgi:hypothetical protein